MNKEC